MSQVVIGRVFGRGGRLADRQCSGSHREFLVNDDAGRVMCQIKMIFSGAGVSFSENYPHSKKVFLIIVDASF